MTVSISLNVWVNENDIVHGLRIKRSAALGDRAAGNAESPFAVGTWCSDTQQSSGEKKIGPSIALLLEPDA